MRELQVRELQVRWLPEWPVLFQEQLPEQQVQRALESRVGLGYRASLAVAMLPAGYQALRNLPPLLQATSRLPQSQRHRQRFAAKP